MDEPKETDAQLTPEIVEMWRRFLTTAEFANARGRLDECEYDPSIDGLSGPAMQIRTVED